MRIVCPNCNFTREVDRATVPPGATRATCPKCHNKFSFNLDEHQVFQAPLEEYETDEVQSLTDLAEEPEAEEEADTPERYRPAPATDIEDMAAGLVAGKAAEEARAPEPPRPPGETPRMAAVRSRAGRIPWEEREGSLLGDWWATLKKALFSPAGFSEGLSAYDGSGFKRPLLFGIITGALSIVFTVVWQLAFTIIGVSMSSGAAHGGEAIAGMAIYMAVILVLSPILMAVALFVWAGFQHLFLIIVRGAGGGFEATFRVLAYASSGGVFSIVPLLGGLIGTIWVMVMAVIGLSKVHNTSTFRVVLAVF
ncbi:MAG: zinc-ribbon domain-containing protein, partial [Proteobacteria bacterium]|nr:zinc-ribbon domain-containing protein [Pseudomonadota bacterium]